MSLWECLRDYKGNAVHEERLSHKWEWSRVASVLESRLSGFVNRRFFAIIIFSRHSEGGMSHAFGARHAATSYASCFGTTSGRTPRTELDRDCEKLSG
jgi:hypothetical protein